MTEVVPPAGPGLYAAERHRHIARKIRANGRLEAAAMAAELQVTPETIRKDLTALERQGVLRRVHGGAIAPEGPTTEARIDDRSQFADEKARIARAALEEVPADGSIFIEVGSTTGMLAELLPTQRDLVVVTNAPALAVALAVHPRLTVLSTGGRVRQRTLGEVDDWALRALDEIRVDVAFLGTNGIDPEHGLTTPNPAEAAVKRRMLAAGARCVLLADHSKIGRVALCRYGDLADVDLLITDVGLGDEAVRQLEAVGARVLLV